MDSTIMSSIIIGIFTFAGVVVTSKFTKNIQLVKLEMKFDELDKKVTKHNSVIERTYALEKEVALLKAREQV